MSEFRQKPMQIEKMQIPDEDVLGWMKVLREGGMTNKEIDDILIHLNKEYADQRLPHLAEQAVKEYNERRVAEGKAPLAGDMLTAWREFARHLLEQELREKNKS